MHPRKQVGCVHIPLNKSLLMKVLRALLKNDSGEAGESLSGKKGLKEMGTN